MLFTARSKSKDNQEARTCCADNGFEVLIKAKDILEAISKFKNNYNELPGSVSENTYIILID